MYRLRKRWFRPIRMQWRLNWVPCLYRKRLLLRLHLGNRSQRDKKHKHSLRYLQFDPQCMQQEQQYRQHMHCQKGMKTCNKQHYRMLQC